MRKKLPILFLIASVSLCAQDWSPTFSEAVMVAKEKDKPIILVFSGSDWCAPCIKLDKNIWGSQEFKNYAAAHYVLYKADFPRKKRNRLNEMQATQNRQLAEKYNPDGFFPLVVVLNKNEEVLGVTAYKKVTPIEYVAHLNSFLK
ncbi:thioredoxin family protein [Allomuricauda sp. SCSIO 65647]|uniref:thioredoxin family protein n=1 Tax=Allomuricauda sp. SCSIO 65647 TaxID=2908843 RepID=UPI001F230F74|nr:thioredoxin family protein [Muricauda sp. SCSIO 65647]UJH66750.1 thioredoxin family protein [Muricauda sp. SCSIO 65647]